MNTSVMIGSGVGLLIIALIIVLIIRHDKKKEGYKQCVCSSDQGGREQNCQDVVEVGNAYMEGVSTETSSRDYSKGWTKVNPGDTQFPLSQGCSWSDGNPDPKDGMSKGWPEWDFPDFGN